MTFLPTPLNTAVSAGSTRPSYKEGRDHVQYHESRSAITLTPPATGSRPGAGRPAARTVVRLRGALDIAAAPALRERLIGILHPGMSLLVIDLSRVPSCDPAGLAILIGTQRRARLLGIVMRLAAPSLPVAKLLRLTGLDGNLTICPDLRDALAVERDDPAKASPSPRVLAG